MVNADLAMRFKVNADRMWAMLTGPDLVPVLLDTYAAKVEMQPGEKGTMLVTTLKSGGIVRERIDSVDPEERCMKYRVLDAGPLPYAGYRGEARVQPCGPDACVVYFQCSFIAVEMPEAEARAYWVSHNTEVMGRLRKVLETG